MKKVFDILKKVLLIFLVCCVAASLYQKLFNNRSIFGFRTFAIVTSSMAPDINVGDIIIVKEIKPKDIKVGDVITYQGMDGDLAGKIVTHKVDIIKDEDGKLLFYTKGLKSVLHDPVVTEGQIYGKVVHVFFVLSLINKIIRTKIGFILCVLIPLVIIYYAEIKSFILEFKENKGKKEKAKKLEKELIEKANTRLVDSNDLEELKKIKKDGNNIKNI